MNDPTLTILLVIAVAVGAGFGLLALRMRRSRSRFEEEVGVWKQKLEGDLDQAREERDQLLNALGEAFLLVDSDERIVFANKNASTMFRGRDLTGRSVHEAFLDQRLSDAIKPCLTTGKAATTRVILPQQASPLGDAEQRGTNVWIVDAARISDNPEDDPVTRVLIRDVTGEHHTEQVRKDFVANASHELRTPLAIINGYLENLLDDGLLEDPDLTRRFLKVMRKHTVRISRIVEDMLVISRLESGETAALKLEPFRIQACVHDVLERLEPVIQAQQASIELEIPDESASINADRFYWTQVLFNLVENALKQNPRSGLKIKIGCEQDEISTRIWVVDDGVGIPSVDLPHIFRRFYRVEKHHSQEEIKGTGLGLSIVKRAIEAHSGVISVSSTPGEETRFSIEVPRRNKARSPNPDEDPVPYS